MIDLVGDRAKRFKVIFLAAVIAVVVFAATFALGGYSESEHLLQKPGGMIAFVTPTGFLRLRIDLYRGL